MTAAPATKKADLFDCFTARADARAYLWSIGEYELSEAVDALHFASIRDGLIDRIGQDAVQTLIADAFRPYREGEHA